MAGWCGIYDNGTRGGSIVPFTGVLPAGGIIPAARREAISGFSVPTGAVELFWG